MNIISRTSIPIRTAIAGALVAAVVALILLVTGVFEADARVSTPDPPTAPIDEDVRVGRILAAYVAPDEVAFRTSAGENVSLPVAGDVSVTVDGETVHYDTFTLSFDDAHEGDAPGGEATYRVTIEDDVVVAIER